MKKDVRNSGTKQTSYKNMRIDCVKFVDLNQTKFGLERTSNNSVRFGFVQRKYIERSRSVCIFLQTTVPVILTIPTYWKILPVVFPKMLLSPL